MTIFSLKPLWAGIFGMLVNQHSLRNTKLGIEFIQAARLVFLSEILDTNGGQYHFQR